jgi:hypothetical protein
MHETQRWNDMEDAHALLDDDRHLGHVFRTGRRWEAWDATRPDPSHSGFLFLGRFLSAEAAKQAVETSVSSRKPAHDSASRDSGKEPRHKLLVRTAGHVN